ncbi:MAG: ADP compounds hydrolase NudE [Gammaproteobacteria bacterium]|nr:ADP compounds hydrolase NudE [Gammaproteobacteria bacterium]
MSTEKPTILATKILATTEIFQVEGVHLRFSNGEERHFERLKGRAHEAVMIIPVLDSETILLIREYGVGLEDYYLGLPKGIVNRDEDILTAANRELMEETGYGARSLQFMKSLSSAPAYTTRTMKVVLAMDLFQQRLEGDEPETIEVVPWKLKDLDLLLERSDFHEARSIAALFMVRELLSKSNTHENR